MHMKTLSSHLHNYGLRYDDLYDPMYDLDVKEALNRLPREIVDSKNQCLLCAMDLFMKHLYLPEDLQLIIPHWGVDIFYCRCLENELKFEKYEYMVLYHYFIKQVHGRFIDSIDCTDGCRPSKMYFLRTLIEKILKDREDFLVEPNSVSNLVPPDEYVHQSCYSFSFLGGFVFLFNRKVLRYFRKDGHNWRRKDRKTVKEAQEKLEIGKRSSEFVMCLNVVAALNCRIRKYNEAIPHLERSIEIPDLDMGQNLSITKFSWFMHLCDTYQCSGS
ncbi:hypothetical protein P3S67_011013 [Capsicum chacoense]